ncbi:MAG: hypothetical protein AABX39_03330 [Nanoarchaeota archaeon]|mgnify:CR=1 FL=1
MNALPTNLEEKLRVLKNVWDTLELREQNFGKKTNLEKLSGTVYADNQLVYKLDPQDTEPEALRRVQGVERVQQFVAFEYGVLVSERIRQKNYGPRSKIERVHLENLLRTIMELRNRDVEFLDCNEGNMLYSKRKGFTLIDLGCKEKPEIPMHNLAVTFSKGKKDEIHFYPLLSRYTEVIDAFYDVDKRLAFETLMKYVCFERDKDFKKINPKSRQFEQIQNTLQKYGLSFDELYCDKGSGRMFLV